MTSHSQGDCDKWREYKDLPQEVWILNSTTVLQSSLALHTGQGEVWVLSKESSSGGERLAADIQGIPPSASGPGGQPGAFEHVFGSRQGISVPAAAPPSKCVRTTLLVRRHQLVIGSPLVIPPLHAWGRDIQHCSG